MVEAAANEVSEAVMTQALVEGHAVIKQIVALQKDLRARAGKPKRPHAKKTIDPAVAATIEGALTEPLLAAVRHKGKIESYARMKKVKDDYVASLSEEQAEIKAAVSAVYDGLREKLLKREIFEQGRRLDGRRFDEVREITSEVGVLPRTHGSALFTRGETQALVTVTLGTSEDAQIIDTVQEAEYRKRFMLHYNFPPFSVGEVKFLRGPGRREIGHGALAERSLKRDAAARGELPLHDPRRLGHPRVERLVLDGQRLRRHARADGRRRADQGPGRGHRDGPGQGGRPLRRCSPTSPARKTTTATWTSRSPAPAPASRRCRWTSRSTGSAPAIMAGALEQARVGRIHILDRMLEALAQPRTEISTYAPRILTIRVPVDKIRDIIGPGGKMIRSIVERTGCKIDIEDDGRVAIASVDESAARKAIAIIEELTATPELNKSYLGKVVRVVEFGAFVEILPGTDGLLHVSEMAHHRVNNVHDEVKEGDQVLVKVVSIDPSGKIRLSRKALLEEAQGGTPGGGRRGRRRRLGRPLARRSPARRTRSRSRWWRP